MIDFAEIIWGRSPTPVPSFFGNASGRHRSAVACCRSRSSSSPSPASCSSRLDLFYRRTLTGKAFRAVAHSGEVSSLMGINTRRVQVASYAAAAALAGLAGFMVVPLTLAEPQMGTVLGLKAFAIAIIAGLAAPRGILVCGLLYGAFEGLVSGYLYTGIRDILGFSLMIVALYAEAGRDIRPAGEETRMMRR